MNWVFDKEAEGDDGSSVYRNSGDAVHSTSLFLEAATRAALLLSHSGLHSDVVTSWEPHLSDMASFVAEHSAIGAYARDSNLEPFAHRYFLRAAGLQGVSVLFGEEAGSLSAAASSLVQEGLSLQTDDGVFPERGGFDFNYQGIGLAYLGRYQQMIESVDSASSSACTASQSLFVDRVDSLGNVDTSDSTRINEPARSGRPKRLDYKTIAQGFISCSLASNDEVYEELAIKMARPIRPTVEYRFEGEADGQKSTGLDDDAAHLFCRTADNAKNSNPLGISGSGLASEADDFALKLTSTGSSMGSGQGSFCRTDGPVDSIDALQSFTLSGYYKVPQVMSNNIELFKTDRMKLTVVNNGKLRLFVDSHSGGDSVVSSKADWDVTDTWAFFAVSYDGTRQQDNVKFYHSLAADCSNLVLSSTQTLDRGSVSSKPSRLYINRQNRPMISDSYLDNNMRIHASKTTSEGALSFENIQDMCVFDTK